MAAKSVGGSRRRFWIMIFLGVAPDLDVIFNVFGGWAALLQHRGLSHSIVGVGVQAVCYSWLFSKWDEGRFWQRSFHYSMPIFFHVLSDYLTCYGVPLFSPFTTRTYSADLMMDLCLIPMVFMALALFWMYRKDVHGWHVTRPIWGIWLIYIMVSVTGKVYATRLAPPSSAHVIALPSRANPFQWRTIYQDGANRKYHYYSVDLLYGQNGASSSVAMPGEDMPVQASLKSFEVKHFIETNRWPVARVTANEKGWTVEWGNLLFSVRGLVRGKVAVKINPDGTIAQEEKIFKFWNPAS